MKYTRFKSKLDCHNTAVTVKVL